MVRVRWCERGDSNPHGFPRQILSSARTKNQQLARERDERSLSAREAALTLLCDVSVSPWVHSITLGRVW